MATRKELVEAVRVGYRDGTTADKTKILDEFIAFTGITVSTYPTAWRRGGSRNPESRPSPGLRRRIPADIDHAVGGHRSGLRQAPEGADSAVDRSDRASRAFAARIRDEGPSLAGRGGNDRPLLEPGPHDCQRPTPASNWRRLSDPPQHPSAYLLRLEKSSTRPRPRRRPTSSCWRSAAARPASARACRWTHAAPSGCARCWLEPRMIKVDAVWLAVQPLDMRLGTEAALACVVGVFGAAHPNHGPGHDPKADWCARLGDGLAPAASHRCGADTAFQRVSAAAQGVQHGKPLRGR